MNDPFYLVWNPTGTRPPRVMHATESAATSEAERLARANPGETFVILEAVATRTVDAMQRVTLRPPKKSIFDDCPF